MCLPAVTVQVSLSGYGIAAGLLGRIALKRGVNAAMVVIFAERLKLSFQVNGIPEQRVVKKLTTNGSNQTLHEGV